MKATENHECHFHWFFLKKILPRCFWGGTVPCLPQYIMPPPPNSFILPMFSSQVISCEESILAWFQKKEQEAKQEGSKGVTGVERFLTGLCWSAFLRIRPRNSHLSFFLCSFAHFRKGTYFWGVLVFQLPVAHRPSMCAFSQFWGGFSKDRPNFRLFFSPSKTWHRTAKPLGFTPENLHQITAD